VKSSGKPINFQANRKQTMADPSPVKSYEVEYAGNVLLDEHDAAIIRFESTAHDKVSVVMGRRLLEHLMLDIQSILADKLPIIKRS
jgi:hypothetical protein